ncbi:MAG: copper chaperone PCu(A)C [Sneathiella sp.]
MKYIKALPLVLLAIMVVVNAESDKFASHAAEVNGMAVTEAWARERPANAMMGGAFLTLKNSEGETDRLVAASSPVADKVEIHNSVMKEGVMSMMHMEELVIEPGETVMLKPGGFHIMLMGLKKPLTKGSEFPLTLTFARAGAITVPVHVKDAGNMGMHKHE